MDLYGQKLDQQSSYPVVNQVERGFASSGSDLNWYEGIGLAPGYSRNYSVYSGSIHLCLYNLTCL